MKICQYCETVNDDSAVACSGCGAGLFYHKCNHCGKLFEGLACPDCGIRADAQAVKCPSCGRLYYASVCPHCGYSPAKERDRTRALEQQRLQLEKEKERRLAAESEENRLRLEQQNRREKALKDEPAKKKRHTLLWILGWLLIFPLPLTILLTRKKSGFFGKLLKTAVILLAWLIYIGLASGNA